MAVSQLEVSRTDQSCVIGGGALQQMFGYRHLACDEKLIQLELRFCKNYGPKRSESKEKLTQNARKLSNSNFW